MGEILSKSEMKIRFRKLDGTATAPRQGTASAAGYDLTANRVTIDVVDKSTIVYTCHSGIAVEIPQGHVGLLFPRSSVFKTRLQMSNGVGVIDSDYRGEIMAKFYLVGSDGGDAYEAGERFAQLVIVPIPSVEYEESDELTSTDRGAGGYGSTGR